MTQTLPKASLRDPLAPLGYIGLPRHAGTGGFDHAAVHAASGHVYVAHTANDAVDVFDPAAQRHLFSIPDLPAVAGVLVSDEAQLIIASARGENTVAVFAPGPSRWCARSASACVPTDWRSTRRAG